MALLEEDMFKVKKRNVTLRYCPNGHEPPFDLLFETDRLKFCHICSAPIEERPVTYDAAYCSKCDNLVNPEWDYCPYCRESR